MNRFYTLIFHSSKMIHFHFIFAPVENDSMQIKDRVITRLAVDNLVSPSIVHNTL